MPEDSGTYPVADDSGSYGMADDDAPAPKPAAPRQPAKPLPRMWKAEPEPEDDAEDPKRSRTKPSGNAKSRPQTAPAKAKTSKANEADPDAPKKVLIEDTPRFDTVESRQRARLLIGGAVIGLVVFMVFITYRTFLYDPIPVTSDDSVPVESSPEIKPSVDQEARFMFNRAHQLARQDHVDQAIEMLTKIVKVYKGTPTAADAQAALERPKKNLPLFLEGPSVVASAESKEAPEPAPGPVVNATVAESAKKQGEAAVELPVNPAEKGMTPPAPGSNPLAAIVGKPLPAGFKADVSHGIHESGWPNLIVGDRDGAPMVLVPAATVPMCGDPDSPAGSAVIQARVSTFYIDQHETTNRQFRLFLRETGYKGQPAGKWLSDESRLEDENRPVVRVNAHDARAYADWAGKLLPTEAQWELAARSFDGRLHPWGNNPPNWSRARAFRQIDPVGTFPEDLSPYGALDMAGNAFEWTQDWFDPRYYRTMAGQTVDNPTGPANRPRLAQLVVKGCSKTFHLGAHDGQAVDKRLPYLGFRCVLKVDSGLPQAPGTPVAAPAQPGQPAQTPAALPGQPAAPPVPF